MELSILKIGGNVLDNKEKLEKLLDHFSSLEGPKILVHGGGNKASELAEKLGVPVKMIEGRRITDSANLEIATMVYGGLINKKIVAGLQSRNTMAIGVCGADLDLIRAKKRPVRAIDYGFVGDIVSINIPNLKKILDAGFVAVFCALTHDNEGQLLNTNADTIATSLAIALSKHYKVKLNLCLEFDGVLKDIQDPNEIYEKVRIHDFECFKKAGIISHGMIPKLKNGFDALENGVQSVKICGPENWYTQKGTSLCIH